MPTLNYKKQFAQSVEDGTKRTTIRAKRKRPFKVGDMLYHYTGMQTEKCRKLRQDVCVEVSDIKINTYIYVDNRRLDCWDVIDLAKEDGLKLNDFIDFFKKTYGFPFHGQIIKW